jgi:hypothetical protein
MMLQHGSWGLMTGGNALALLALIGSATAEPEKIGTATLIRTSVGGDYGEMVVRPFRLLRPTASAGPV